MATDMIKCRQIAAEAEKIGLQKFEDKQQLLIETSENFASEYLIPTLKKMLFDCATKRRLEISMLALIRKAISSSNDSFSIDELKIRVLLQYVREYLITNFETDAEKNWRITERYPDDNEFHYMYYITVEW